MRAPEVIERPGRTAERAHQFDTAEQQRHAATLGLWLFLATEVLFFGGLFFGYTVYRVFYPHAFREASSETLVACGAVNTAVLLISSFLVALAVRASSIGTKRQVSLLLGGAALLGFAFLGIKAFEYATEIHEGLLPGAHFHFHGAEPEHARIFFSFYFVMTGLHAAHVTIGIAALIYYALRHSRQNETSVELVGLYWHFVDLVWVFLFPLLYLVGRTSPHL